MATEWRDAALGAGGRQAPAEREAFRTLHPLAARAAEVQRIVAKYPGKVPVVLERAPGCTLPALDKQKFLVPEEMTVEQFGTTVEQRMTKATGAEDHRISLFVDPLAGKAHAGSRLEPKLTAGAVYQQHKEAADGFLYLGYSDGKETAAPAAPSTAENAAGMRMPGGPEPEEGVVDPQAEATRRLAETRDAGTEEAVGRLEAAEAKAAEQTSPGWWVLGLGGGVGLAAAAPELAAAATAAAGVAAWAAPVAAAAGAAPVAIGVGLAAVSAVALSGAAAVPEHWVPDADRTHCKGCSREFGVLTRRHHCRGCGEVMCHHCAPHRPAGERACKSCSAAAGPA